MGKSPGIKKINSALNMSIEFFNKFNHPINETSKNIIIFSAGNVEPITDQIRSLIKDNYNVITVQISENGESVVLKTVHSTLGGLNSDYYLCNPNNTGSENHSSAEWIMKEISKTIGSMIYPTYLLSNVKMNFNLGNNIDLVGNGLTRVELGTKKYTKALPQIKYKIEYENGLPKQTVDGKLIYVGYFLDPSLIDSKNYLVNFKITTSPNAHGLCEFSIPNEITYNYVELGAVGSTEISETPKLRLEEFTVDHGVYKGMNGSLASIDTERDKLKFATGALVTFASNIQGLYGGPISLAIDNDCKFEGVIKIYNIDTGVLIDIITPEVGVNKKVISIDYQIYHNIFIIYNVKLNGTSKIYYENDIQINGMNYPAYVSPSSSLLPDLF